MNGTFETIEAKEAMSAMGETAICRLCPLDAVLSSGICVKKGALHPVTGLTVLLIGLLLARPSQYFVLLVKQSVT